MRKIFTYFFIASALHIPVFVSAQVTKIMGSVVDADTKEPLPFVNIVFKSKLVGYTTDFKGNYTIETKSAGDTLIAACLGYETMYKKVVKNKFQTINFELAKDQITLKEVVIKLGENPAEILLRKIINNKEMNNPDNIEIYQYEVYNKIQFDANNIKEKLKGRKVMKPFQFIFDNIDTSVVNGKAYLPIFLTETVSDYFFRKDPKSHKEIIKASKVSGIQNESITQFLGNMYQNINIYDNYVELFEKNFVSPIADFGLAFYKYYLIDSTYIDNKWCYKIVFKPRRKQELTFTGEFWVNDTSFAIKKVDVKIADDANINFINGAVASQEYNLIDGKHWMVVKESVTTDFNVFENSKKTIGFYGHKTTLYKDFVFETPKEKEFYANPLNIIVDDNSYDKDNEYWEKTRHEELTIEEKSIYKMVDSIKKVPIFNTYVDLVKMFTLGYYIWGNFELGPYYTTYSFNQIEGNRFRIGGRTSNKFSTKFMPEAHLAYGTKDEKFKYSAGFLYMLSKNPRKSFGASYKYDIEQLGQSQNAFREDNIISSVFRRNPSDKLSMVEEYKGFYEHEWFTGFSNTVSFYHRDIFSLGATKFEFCSAGNKEVKSDIVSTEIELTTRFAYREKYLMGEFERISLGTKYPVLEIKYTYGIKDLWLSDYEYTRLQACISHWFNIGTIGWSKYVVEAGRIWGKLPYPLLKLHEGNETYYFDEYAFNMMNYLEFVSDKYVSFYYTHHFDGFFFNKVPLFRKLKWREVAQIKGVVGSLEEKNKTYSSFPATLNELSKPYFETGVGIENIFKILRVDALWRLSYLDHPNIAKFGIMGTLQFYF